MNEDLRNGLLDAVSKMKSSLIRRGLMNEDGNMINVRQLPKSMDAAAIAIVQEHQIRNTEN